jgi:hypothetical protein
MSAASEAQLWRDAVALLERHAALRPVPDGIETPE